MRQPGVTVRPIRQLTGTSEFNEVFFDEARTAPANVVGAPGDGWRVAMGTLGFERGAATLGQQVGFERELDELVELARPTGAATDPQLRERLTRAWIGLESCGRTRSHPARRAGRSAGAEASVLKLLWSRWHQALGELAMDVRGAGSMVGRRGDGELDAWQRLFLFSRADTIYGGSNEIQRNIIAERALGLPRPGAPMTPITPPKPAGRATACSTGKVVVVTAAAGTGIGSAAARALPGGGRRRGDQRPATSAGSARPATSSRPRTGTGSGRCRATSPTRARSSALIDGAVERFGRIDVLSTTPGSAAPARSSR